MKTFKQCDVALSLLLSSVFAGVNLARRDETFLYGYFVTGGWQVISMVVHAINGWFTEKGSTRRNYYWLVLIIICLGVLTFLILPLGFIYYIMLFAAAPMAIIYTRICFVELKKISSRPLDLIK